ncbi:glycosyltransferase family 2 protein [Pseudonocardia sp. TRM90224]|uniref:glycosyltransferase family 2 protein n=1 Tax=Pseudonocardia sp. TRM90224 TaxID=2812678 RepID=UPI001E5D409E|nr:glycosyltransferase [Pseudonocardia sp. TRM90224]
MPNVRPEQGPTDSGPTDSGPTDSGPTDSGPNPGPTVDVAVPCYRYGEMLPTAVRSVLDQEGVTVRVLVIDDASGDGSADVAAELAAADDRVTVSVHEQNRGHIATFNEGVMEWAAADYTMLLSADDALPPGALRRATALMEADPDVAFVYGNALDWDGSLPLPPARTAGAEWKIYSGQEWLRRRFALGVNPVSSPAAIVRTSVQKQAGGYDPELLHTSDLEVWMRLALYGKVGFIAHADQAYVRGHASNMSVAYEDRDGGVGDLRMRLLAYTTLVRKSAGRLRDAERLERKVRRRLAGDALLRVSRSYDKGRYDERAARLLVEFASETVGGAAQLNKLPEWHALRVRTTLGQKASAMLSPLVLTAAARRLRQVWRRRRLDRAGV